MQKMSKKAVYAVYDGDTFVAMGTSRELSELLGVKPETISWLSTPTYWSRRKNPEKGRVVIRVEDEEWN